MYVVHVVSVRELGKEKIVVSVRELGREKLVVVQVGKRKWKVSEHEPPCEGGD